jgi:uncharacterized membrane protein YwzB
MLLTPGKVQPWHNQTSRFKNVTELIKYVCEDNLMGPTGFGNAPQFTFQPICEFPFINKGWNDNGVPGMGDVVFNDCSITLADSIKTYNQTCLIMVCIALFPTLLSCHFLRVLNYKKKPKDRNWHWFWLKKPNVSEQMLLLGIILGIAHTLRCIDVLGYAGRLTVMNEYTVSERSQPRAKRNERWM